MKYIEIESNSLNCTPSAMRSSSSSSTSNASLSSSFKYYFDLKMLIFMSIICLLFSTATANGYFNPLIQLPTDGIYSNFSTRSTAQMVLNIFDFGAVGDGFTDDTKSLEDIWMVACSSSARAKIVIPKGNSYLIRPTDFAGPCRSRVTLRISGMIIAPGDPAVWHGLNIHRWLYFHRVKHLKVEGGGTINGRGTEWWARSCKRNESNPCTHAPTALTFHKCNNLKVRNINLVYSQQMHLAFTQCARVAASGITIVAPADSPNTDGIHISASTHVEFKDMVIGTGDDCISIVSNSSGIRIRNIYCGPGHGISIGSLGKYNSTSSVQNVSVKGAVFHNTENGVRIKTWQGGSGFARKILFENIWMRNVSNPIIIDQYYCDSPLPCPNQTSAVIIDNVSFRGISGTSATEEAIRLSCSDTCPCKRLYLGNIQLTMMSGTAKSFCWEAYGRSTGSVYPSSCLSSGDIIIRHQVNSNSTSWLKDDYALF